MKEKQWDGLSFSSIYKFAQLYGSFSIVDNCPLIEEVRVLALRGDGE